MNESCEKLGLLLIVVNRGVIRFFMRLVMSVVNVVLMMNVMVRLMRLLCRRNFLKLFMIYF